MTRLVPNGSLLVLVLACWGLPTRAEAQSSLERGQQALAEADFAGAASAFDEAEAADAGLSRQTLLDLYVARAQAHLALGDRDAAREDVRRLLTVNPEHELDYRVRPEIRHMAEELGDEVAGPIEVAARVRAEPAGLAVTASAGDAPLVRAIRVFGRVRGGEWLSGAGSVVVPVASEREVEYYAEAIGPGGAVIATDGTEDAPLRHAYTGPDATGEGSEVGGESSGLDELVPWLVVGGIVAVGIAILVTVLVVTNSSSDATQPAPPIVFPPM